MEIYISQKEREKGREEATPPSDVSFVDNGALEKNWGELDVIAKFYRIYLFTSFNFFLSLSLSLSFPGELTLPLRWLSWEGPLSVSFPPPFAESHFKCYYPKAFEEGGFCKAVVVCAAVWRFVWASSFTIHVWGVISSAWTPSSPWLSAVVKCSMTNRRGGSSIILGGGLTLRWQTSPDLDLKWLLYQLAGSLRRRWALEARGFWGGI